MAEIICIFTFPERNDESNYIIVDSTITFHQLKNFLVTSQIIDESFTIETASNEVLTDENLVVLIAEAVNSDSPLQIVFKSKAAGSQPTVPEPSAQQELPEAKQPIGPTMRSILEKIGVKFDDNILSDAQKCLSSLPFPYSFLFKQYLEQILANPNILQSIVQQTAQMFSVDEKILLDEVNVALDFIKNPPAPEPVVQRSEPEIAAPKKEEAEAEAPKAVVGPILAQILKEHFGVEESCLNSADQIQKVVNRLPMFHVLLTCVAANPNILHSFANGLAHRFTVDREKVFEELKQFVELLRGSKSQESAQPNPPVPGRRFNRSGRCNRWRRRDVHPATCDSCKSMISGVRYYCLHCKNYDLCSTCEQKNTDAPFHDESHIFAKIRDPATPYRIDDLIQPNAEAPHPSVSQAHPPHPFGFPFPHCFSGESPAPNHSHPRFRCAAAVPNAEQGNVQPESPWFKHRAETKNRLDQLEASVKQLKETISQLHKSN